MHEVVRSGDQIAFLIFDPHGDKRNIVTIGFDLVAVRDQADFRRSARGVHFVRRYLLAFFVSDRFQRAAYYEALLPEPKNEREAVAGIFAIARNVSVPFGAPYESFGIYNTEYRTVMNLTDKRYYFELTTSPNVIWADLAKMDGSIGAPVLVLDPDDLALSGDVTSKFKPAKAAF